MAANVDESALQNCHIMTATFLDRKVLQLRVFCCTIEKIKRVRCYLTLFYSGYLNTLFYTRRVERWICPAFISKIKSIKQMIFCMWEGNQLKFFKQRYPQEITSSYDLIFLNFILLNFRYQNFEFIFNFRIVGSIFLTNVFQTLPLQQRQYRRTL